MKKLVLPLLFLACSSQTPAAAPPAGDVDPALATPTTPDATATDANANAPAPPTRCDPDRGASMSVSGFTRFVVDADARGPAFTSIGDMNGDGRLDLVVSTVGPVISDGTNVTLSKGHVTVYLQGQAGLGCWEKRTIVGDEAALYFPNQTSLADLDGDGDLDVVVPTGFFVCAFDKAVRNCGGIVWFENQSGGTSWKRHDIVPAADPLFYHQAVVVDFDRDGRSDLVTVGESGSGAKARWFRGDASDDRFEKAPREIAEGGGSFPSVADVDGDGDLDVLSAEYFVPEGSFAWFERKDDGTFERHVVSTRAATGRGFEIELVPNLFGDGKAIAVATNHTNITTDAVPRVESAVWLFEPANDPKLPWRKTLASKGIESRPSIGEKIQGAPGVFGVGDIDGDGDIDILVAGDGDAKAYWMEQKDRAFEMHVIEEQLGQAASAHVVDLDGDGRSELVFTGYEDRKVYVYARAE